MFIGGVVTIQMGGLWHCFNHISGVGSSCSLSCQTRCQTRCLRGFINLAVSSLSHGLTWPWLGVKKTIFSDAPISSLLLVCHIISNYILIRLGYVYIYNMYHQCPWLFTLHYPMSWLNIPCFCMVLLFCDQNCSWVLPLYVTAADLMVRKFWIVKIMRIFWSL